MRLPENIVMETEETFGVLRFSAIRHTHYAKDDNNNDTDEVVRRTYDLKSPEQGRMIQVSLPESVEEKKFPYNAEVELVNPKMTTFISGASARTFEAEWACNADDIVLKRTSAQGGNPQQGQNGAQPPHGQPRKDEKKE